MIHFNAFSHTPGLGLIKYNNQAIGVDFLNEGQASPKTTLQMKKKLLLFAFVMEIIIILLLFRVFYIQAFEANFLQMRAFEQHTRDRLITPNRGHIYDRNGVGLAVTETVSSVSVIRAQITDPEKVARVLSEKLEMDYDEVMVKISRRVALERIATKVDKDVADAIRAMNLDGVVIDEDVLRVYPYSSLAAQVIGFVGRDNQGIIGLEAKFDAFLAGERGRILTETDGRGMLLHDSIIIREEPTPGYNLITSLDVVVQRYAEQTIRLAVEAKQAQRGLIVVMNPQTGEIYAMANEPSFDLNDPFTINSPELASLWGTFTNEQQMNHLNQMWRNFAINDTFEPGSTAKIMTGAAGLQSGVITPQTMFNCGGAHLVGDRFIRCWRSPRSHGALNFIQGFQHSCNPVFMVTGEKIGAELFYEYMGLFGFNRKTGIDLPGEAVGIMHRLENVGPVELATMSFGQSYQITPLQLMAATAATVNGGFVITPHVGLRLEDADGNIVQEFTHERGERILSEETSQIMVSILESVVQEGTGNRTYLPGMRIGGKTATSEKLPRRSGKYIASFITFAPADNPQVMAFVLIDEPRGAYYGGQVAGPIMKELLTNILPYLGVVPVFSEAELAEDGVGQVEVPNLIGQNRAAAVKSLREMEIDFEERGSGSTVVWQFPLAGEMINANSKIILFLE